MDSFPLGLHLNTQIIFPMIKACIVVTLILFFLSCARDTLTPEEDNHTFGSDTTLDIATWNIENFPKQSGKTVDYIQKLTDTMDVDIIALQEIGDEEYFNSLVSQLSGWNGFRQENSWGLAYLYKSEIQVQSIQEIAQLDDYNLTRTPLMMEFIWAGETIYLINNHYKCCGDGIIQNVYNDEEYRRQQSCILTKNYIDANLANENVILVGDLNDELNDPDTHNVFISFINDNENFLFVDEDIAFGSETHWSYPGWPSHLDHILITNELFDNFNKPDANVTTVKLEEVLTGGWTEYEKYVSDHRPVAVRLVFDNESSD